MTVKKIGSFQLRRTQQLFKLQKTTLPKILGNEAKNFFLLGFRKGGFTDKGFKKWAPRFKRLTRTRVLRTEKEPSNLIGKGTGKLRRSIAVRRATFSQIKIGTSGIPYAARHNLGLKGMPERKFIGDSDRLDRQMERRLFREMDKVFR